MNKPPERNLTTLALVAELARAQPRDARYMDDVKPSRVKANRGKKANRKRQQAGRRGNRR